MNKDSMQSKLQEIATLREIKGEEKKVFKLVEKTKKEAEKYNDWESLAKLYWEESLNSQHSAMNEKIKDISNEKIIEKAIERMQKAAENANEIIKHNNLKHMFGRSHRFLGRCYTYKKEYEKAHEEYLLAMEDENMYGDKKNTLEVKGFLAHSLIMLGDVDKGINLATKTFDEFENTKEGKKLKKEDYVTWAIWRSGIFTRIASEIPSLDINLDKFDKEKIKEYLEKSQQILIKPEGKITWGGDQPFSYRKKEVEKSISLLEKLVIFILITIPAYVRKYL